MKIRTSAELSEAIAESVRLFPDDPDAAAEWIRTECEMTPEIGLSLVLQGQRELSVSN